LVPNCAAVFGTTKATITGPSIEVLVGHLFRARPGVCGLKKPAWSRWKQRYIGYRVELSGCEVTEG